MKTSPTPMADEFADERSVDCKGRRIVLGDYVEATSNDESGVVVAIAGEAVIFQNDRDGAGIDVGRFVADAGYNLTLRPRTLDVIAHVRQTAADGEHLRAARAKFDETIANARKAAKQT